VPSRKKPIATTAPATKSCAAATPDTAAAAAALSAAQGADAAHGAPAAPLVQAERTERELRVLRRFRSVFNAVKTHFQQVEKQAGIGGAQVWALSLIRAQPGIGVGALARAMDVHQTTASNLVRSLVAAGLVESHRSGVDRRASHLKATRAATRVLSRAPGPFTGVLPEALGRLDAVTLSRLDADLEALLTLLKADRRGERIPLSEI
jgi:DNA-binding MarR family transcriptional regulator